MAERIRQQYHLEPGCGLLNDPNGLSWFDGKYYVFFQWNRFEKNHAYKEWGRFTSENLIDWRFEGSALVPDQDYDQNGIYSGSAYVIDGELYLFYTGNKKDKGIRKSSQCLAVTKDGKTYIKEGVVLDTPNDYTEHFRDPKVFRGKHSEYFMLVGGQGKNGKGAVALCNSKNGKDWQYQKMAASSEQCEMIECPDLFELDGRSVLLFNPQKRNNETDEPISGFSAYKIMDTNVEDSLSLEINLDVDCEILDAGFDFYAPQTFQSPDGRRILLAWMSRMNEEQERKFSQSEPDIHCMTIPREISLQSGVLFQRPIRELYGLLGDVITAEPKKDGWYIKMGGRNFYMQIKDKGYNSEICIDFHNGEAFLKYDSTCQRMEFTRINWVTGDRESRTTAMKKWNDIEIWSDYSSIEIFLDGGRMVFSARIFPKDRKPGINISGQEKDMEINVHRITDGKEKKRYE